MDCLRNCFQFGLGCKLQGVGTSSGEKNLLQKLVFLPNYGWVDINIKISMAAATLWANERARAAEGGNGPCGKSGESAGKHAQL